jgi:hypothetical protein
VGEFLRDYVNILPAVVAVINGALAVLSTHYPFRSIAGRVRFIAIIVLLSSSAIGATFYSQHLVVVQRAKERAQREMIREQLGSFIAQGNELLRRLANPADQSPIGDLFQQVNQWALSANGFLQTRGPSYPARFFSDAGLLGLDTGAQVSEDRHSLWRYVNTRVARLEQFSQELPSS